MKEIRVRCDDARDRFVAGRAAFEVARHTQLSRRRCQAAALCASELASNAARHAGGGVLVVRPLPEGTGVELSCRDRGPGFSSPEEARNDGWSRGKALRPHDPRVDGLGAGLGTLERLATRFHITSEAGETIVVAQIEE